MSAAPLYQEWEAAAAIANWDSDDSSSTDDTFCVLVSVDLRFVPRKPPGLLGIMNDESLYQEWESEAERANRDSDDSG